MTTFGTEAHVYLDHVAALLVPGRKVKSHNVMPPKLAAVGNLSDWSNDDVVLLLDECRRTLDGQHQRFDRLRTTAQVLLPIAIALLVVIGADLRDVMGEPSSWLRYILYAAWGLGMGLVLMSGLGAAATLSVRSDFGTVLPTLVSQLTPPVRPQVARAYAQQIAVGETTVATRITVIRDAVTLLALGGVSYVVLWFVLTL